MAVFKDKIREVIDELRGEDIAALSLERRCRLISLFSRAIVMDHGAHHLSSGIDTDDDIDESACPDAIDLLRRMVRSLTYSPALLDWFLQSQLRLMEDLRERLPVEKLRHDWRKASPNQRRAQVADVLKMQCDAYTIPAVSFFPPRIVNLQNARASTWGSVDFSQERLTNRLRPPVEIRNTLFANETPDDAVKTGHHETVHYLLFYLALRAHMGELRQNHPLRGDADMEIAKIQHGAVASPRIRSCYMAQPEEDLCYDAEAYMDAGWLKPGPL